MTIIVQLNIQNIRNLSEAKFKFHPKLNLIIGPNGSGKSSLLEAVYYLGTTRSFRTHHIQALIQKEHLYCLAYGEIKHPSGVSSRIGLQRWCDGRKAFHINGEKIAKTSSLAQLLPMLVLDPNTIDIVIGPPRGRRRFLNWGVFHVEPAFSGDWVAAKYSLIQRNKLLKKLTEANQELETWTKTFVEQSERIDTARSQYVRELKTHFVDICYFLSGLRNVECIYQPGWHVDNNLYEILKEQIGQDLYRGYTSSGCHRADLQIIVDGESAARICSRGELKAIAWALILSQATTLSSSIGTKPLFLVDDLLAEFDRERKKRVCKLLNERGGQIFATSTGKDALLAAWGPSISRLFHMEQGRVIEEV